MMNKRMNLLGALSLSTTLSLSALFGVANAKEYTSLDTEASNVTFNYSQMNVKMKGKVTELKANELRFNPEQPDDAKLSIEVALSGVDTGNADANNELAKNEWLAISQHPLATFNATKVKALGDNNYEVQGELAIKGHSQLISAPFSFTEDGDKGIFKGNFSFKRNDFSIGEGQWKSTGIVADGIDINFEIVTQ
jgi:polyisoprenoid-binding protein YceI